MQCSTATTRGWMRAARLASILIWGAAALCGVGCQFLAGAAVGGATGYVVGHEQGDDDRDVDDD